MQQNRITPASSPKTSCKPNIRFPISKIQIGRGGISGTVADNRIIFKNAILQSASAIIIAHNHPSGNLLPSLDDIKLTQRVKEAGKLFEIPVLDHIIVGNDNYYSFADDQKL